jgi:hypothetical protein
MLLDGRRDEDAWAAHARYRILWDVRYERMVEAKITSHCDVTVKKDVSQGVCASWKLG